MRARISALSALLAPVLMLAVLFPLLCPAAARADSPYVRGLELYRQGKYDDAVKVLRTELPPPPPPPPGETGRIAPPPPPPPPSLEDARVRAVLGFTLLRMNMLPEAEEQFELVRQDQALEPVGLLGAGWAAYARGRTSAAVELFNEAAEKAAKSAPGALPDMLRESVPADARLALGLIALGRGRAEEGLRHLETAATDRQDVLGSPKELYIALGDARALAGDRAGALSAWADVPRRSSSFPGDTPRDELARLKAARLHETAGDLSAALSGYTALASGRHYQAEAALGQARALLAQGREAEALPALRRLVGLDPKIAESLRTNIATTPALRPVLKDWGLSYFHHAEYADALVKFSAYLDDVDPSDRACQVGMGWSHLRLGQPDRAWAAFSEAGKSSPASPEALTGMGAAALALGRADQARQILGQALAISPGYALALGTLGHLELSQGNGQNALELFRRAVKARPDYVDGRLSVARLLFDRAEYDAAAAEYFRLVTLEKRSTAGWNGLGWARMRQNQYGDAISAFAEARRLNPNQPAAAYGLGIALARQGKADLASKRLAEAIFLNPDYASTQEVLDLMRTRPEYLELFLEMGEAYARKLYPTTAAPYLEEYLRQNPNSRQGRRALGWASFWAGQEDKAHALFQTLITVNKDDDDAHLGDGLALLSHGHLDMAEPHLRDAVRLDPSNSLAWRALSLLLMRQGRDKEAVALQRQAPKSRMERLDRMSASGFGALAEGRVRDAVRDFRRAVMLDPSLAAPRYGLAFAQVALGDPQQARKELLAGLNLDPAFLDDQELAQLLAQHPVLGALSVDLAWSRLYALNLDSARAGFERNLTEKPGSMEALFGLGATAYLQADWATAETCFDKLLPRAPSTAPSWDKWSHLMVKLGWSAYNQQKYDKALHAFDWLRTYHPETPYAAPLAGMGWALLGKGQTQQAQVLFMRSLDIFPRNLTAMQGMTALKKAPETDDEDMDDEPEPLPKVKKAKNSKSRKRDEAREVNAEKRSKKKAKAEETEKPTKKKSGKKPAQDDAPEKPAKKSKKKADSGEAPEKPAKKSKKAKKAEQ